MHAYKLEVNDFVLAPTAREDFWSASTGRTILPHGTFGQHILPGRAGGENTGSEKSMVSHGAAAKVWFQSRQNYDSRHKTDVLRRVHGPRLQHDPLTGNAERDGFVGVHFGFGLVPVGGQQITLMRHPARANQSAPETCPGM